MRIGIDAHSLEENQTGVGRYLSNLLKYWKDEDIVLYFKKEIPKPYSGKVLNCNSNALFMHYYLPKAAKKDKVDVLFCPGYVAPVFYKGDIVVSMHDIIYEARPDLYNSNLLDKILLKKISKISAKKAKKILTCSEFSKKEIIKHYKVDNVFVIPLAADIKKEKKDISHIIKGNYIFFIGTLFKRRYIPEMIKATDKLLIIGKNIHNYDLKGAIHKERAEEKYLASLYSQADLFIWLSEYEGFGLPPLEAMSCGTPVITTKKGSLPETVGNAAVFVEDPKDVEEIKEKIEFVRKNKEELIKKGLEQAKKFSWERTAERTLEVIKK